MMRRRLILSIFFVLFGRLAAPAVERFPPPEFESGYQLPSPTTPPPRADLFEYIDVAVLFLALAAASWLVHKKRSRSLIFALMLFSLAYFGFYRKGCICPVGAIQNVVLAIFDSTYTVPVTVILFFVLPLVFTLFFGRTFCAAVCPLGAVQDLFVLKPVAIPVWLESSLRLLAYLYLGFGVLFAATGSAFVICRYDPFVAFFRMTGSFNMIVVGICMLIIGIFIARPYCRFLCPYGVILRQLSRISKWRVTITPDECISCRLCEDACPFGAIRAPTAEWAAEDYSIGRGRLAILLAALPLLILLGGWSSSRASGWMARVHSTVRLADRIYLEETGGVSDTTDASAAFRATGRQIKDLYAEAGGIEGRVGTGSWILGCFMGLLVGLKLIAHSIRRTRTDYKADRASCLACGRCFEYCPREHLRRQKQDTEGQE